MASLAGLLANPMLEQILLYNVVGSIVGAAIQPFTLALSTAANQVAPNAPLSPGELADAVIRNLFDPTAAAHEASMSGINAERFAVQVGLAGNAPDPQSLAVALRRGLIDAGTYDRGIRQGRLRDEWADLVRELAVVQPSPESMLAAYLEGQLSEGEARTRFAALGGAPEYFDILFHTQGQAPTPVQALELANRGIIPWGGSGVDAVSFEQAFLEGPWRNKWEPAFRALGAYLPPPRTVTAMHREGSLSTAEATTLLEHQGLTPALASAYLSSSSKQGLAKTKELAEATVLALYRDRIISRAVAAPFLERLGWSPAEAEYILEVEDFRLEERAITAAVGRIHALYTGHKIDRAGALAALAQLGLEATAADQLATVWDHERAANVKHLTPAEIGNALHLTYIDQATAMALLEGQGYVPHDAWLYLSVHLKARLPGEP